MLSIGLHCRLIGRPGRAAALKRALQYMEDHDDVWFATRLEIAEHWAAIHPPKVAPRPSQMSRQDFVAAYGGIFEHSPWIAERAYALELGPTHDTARSPILPENSPLPSGSLKSRLPSRPARVLMR